MVIKHTNTKTNATVKSSDFFSVDTFIHLLLPCTNVTLIHEVYMYIYIYTKYLYSTPIRHGVSTGRTAEPMVVFSHPFRFFDVESAEKMCLSSQSISVVPPGSCSALCRYR